MSEIYDIEELESSLMVEANFKNYKIGSLCGG